MLAGYRYDSVRLIFALLLCGLCGGAIAASIHAYKAVHADGTVSYSDTRPESAQSVTSVNVPGSDSARLEEGEQRKQEMRDIGKQLEEQRAQEAKQQGERAERLAEARREVVEAERNLANTRQSKRSATPERIRLAEERLQLARRRLRQIEGGAP